MGWPLAFCIVGSLWALAVMYIGSVVLEHIKKEQ